MNHVRLLSGAVEPGGDAAGIEIVAGPFDPRFEQPLSGLYWQMSRNGEVIDTSRSLWDETLALPDDELKPGETHLHTITGPGGSTLYVVEQLLTVAATGVDQNVRILAAQDHKDIDEAVGDFQQEMFVYLAILWSFLLLAAWAQVTVGLGPLTALRQRIKRIRSGEEKRLNGDLPKEVAPLADELNSLIEEQEQSILRARTRAGELAHGLKTPLTVLAGASRELRQRGEAGLAGDIQQQVESMRRHVERELARVRLAVVGRSPEPLPLRPVVDVMISTMRKMPRGGEIDWSNDVGEDVSVPIERADATELIGNLLDNARKWARSRVRVVASSGPNRSFTIEDDGPGIPAEDRERVRARGERLDPARSGSGLGLAIVEDIADAYGFELALAPSALGGLGAQITIPERPPRKD
jgi:signal transduction histidine kinase